MKSIRFFPIFLMVVGVGCGALPISEDLTAEGEKVMIVDAMGPSDFERYALIGEVKASGRSVSDLRKAMRNAAAARGASLVKIVSTEPGYCDIPNAIQNHADTKYCYDGIGEAYRSKVVEK